MLGTVLGLTASGTAAAEPADVAAPPARGEASSCTSRGLWALVRPFIPARCSKDDSGPSMERAASVTVTTSAGPAADDRLPQTAERKTTYGAAIPEVAPAQRTDCTPAADLPVPSIVASVFRCRLTLAGYSAGEIRHITAEALMVADCESRFDPEAVVFDGVYLDTPHPQTGYRYSAAGVFQFIRTTGDRWIEGGYANAKDPVANADAAARLYIHNRESGGRSWQDWACAAAHDGFKTTSVLPGWPGGPAELPAWTYEF